MGRPATLLAWALAALVMGGRLGREPLAHEGRHLARRVLVRGGCASGMDCVWSWGMVEGRGGRSEMGLGRSREHLCEMYGSTRRHAHGC